MYYKVGVITWMVRTALWALSVAALAYVVVFVPVGRYALYGHAARIAATPEAQELSSTVSALVSDRRQALVREVVRLRPSERDASDR